jgi:hypothetical protein
MHLGGIYRQLLKLLIIMANLFVGQQQETITPGSPSVSTQMFTVEFESNVTETDNSNNLLSDGGATHASTTVTGK